MVNDTLHGEWRVDDGGGAAARPADRRHMRPSRRAGGDVALVLPPRSGAARQRTDRSHFMQMTLFQILIKVARPGEPRFQGSRVWSATGEYRNDHGDAGGRTVKGQGHVFPPPDGVLAERRPRAAAKRWRHAA